MESDSLLEDLKRKTLLLEDDMNYLIKLCTKVIGLGEKKEEDYHKLVELTAKYAKVEDEIVRFNVGGTMFATSKSNITKKISTCPDSPGPSDNLENVDQYYEPNLLEGLINGLTDAKRDSSEAIFIDRSPKYFDTILNFLRCANTSHKFKLAVAYQNELDELTEEAEFYNMKALIAYLSPKYSIRSNILDQSNQTQNLIELIRPLKPFEGRIEEFKLLYRASEHGFASAAFHQRCDYQAKTLTIIKSANNNYIFGGCVSVAWDSSGSYKPDQEAFIFSLVNQSNRPLTIRCDPTSIQAIYCNNGYGPAFGGGHDLMICTNANTTPSSYSKLGFSYKHPDYLNGTAVAQSFLAGGLNFTISEIEVFQAVVQKF